MDARAASCMDAGPSGRPPPAARRSARGLWHAGAAAAVRPHSVRRRGHALALYAFADETHLLHAACCPANSAARGLAQRHGGGTAAAVPNTRGPLPCHAVTGAHGRSSLTGCIPGSIQTAAPAPRPSRIASPVVVAAALEPGPAGLAAQEELGGPPPSAGHAAVAAHSAAEPGPWNGVLHTAHTAAVGELHADQRRAVQPPPHLRQFTAASQPAGGATADTGRSGAGAAEADSISETADSGFVEVDLGEGVVLRLPAAAAATAAGDAAASRSRRLKAAMELTRQLRWAASWRQVRELLAAAPPGSLDEVHLSTAATRLRAVAPPGQGPAGGGGGGAAAASAAAAEDDARSGHGARSRRGSGAGGRAARSGAGGVGGVGTSGSRAAKRERAAFRTFVAGLTELCGLHLPGMTAAPLTGVLYALAMLKCPPPADWMEAWLAAAAERMEPVAAGAAAAGGGEGDAAPARGTAAGRSGAVGSGRESGFGPQELSNCMYALGQLGFEPGDDWMQRYCAAAARFLPATAAAPPPPPSLPAAAAAAVPGPQSRAPNSSSSGSGSHDSRSAFTAQGLSQVAWGFARLGFVPEPAFLSALLSAVRRSLPDFTAQGLANTLWAAASLGLAPPAPWVAAAAAAALRLLPSCSAYDLSVALWALLRLGHTPGPDWLSAYLAASYRQLPSASPEQAARMLWCCAAVGLPPPGDWVRRWLGCSYVRLLEAEPAALTTMAYALAALGIRPTDRWSDMLLVAAWEAPLRSFQPPDLALLLWGLAHCRVVPEPAWMDEWWAVSYKRLRSFTPRHLSLLLWSCVTIGQAPSRQWLAGYEAVTLPAMPYMTSQGLSLLSYTYGCLERRPPRAWLAALYGAAAGVPSDCGSQQSDGAELAAVEAGVEAPDEACGVAADVVVAGSAYEGLSRFTALGLERLLWGIAKMAPPAGSLPDDVLPGWTDAFLAAAAARLLPGHVVSSSSNSGSGVHGAGIGAGAAIAAGAGPGSSSRPAAAGAADADDFPTHGAGGGVVGLGEAGLGGEEEEADGTYGNVANTLYALALLRVRPEAAWLLPVMDRVEELLPDFGHTTLVKVSWALPRLTSGPPTHRPFTASTAPAAEAAAVHLEMPAPRDGDGAAGSPAAPANAGRDVAGEQRRLRERLASLQRLVTSRMRRTIGGRRLAGAAVAAGSGAAPDAVSDSEAADWDESLEEPGVGEPVSGVAGDVLGSRSAAGGEEDGPATAGGDGAPRPRARRRAVQRE